VRKAKPLPMPPVDVLGKGSELLGCGGGEDWVVADLGELLGMEGTQVIGQHKRSVHENIRGRLRGRNHLQATLKGRCPMKRDALAYLATLTQSDTQPQRKIAR
jgi:hypothetical protein